MKIRIDTIGDVNVVRLSGILDSITSAQVHQALQPIVKAGGKLLLDMQDVQTVTSASMAMLHQLYRKLQPTGGRLAMFNLPPGIKQVFEMTGISVVLSQFESEEEAVAAMSQIDSPGP